MANLTLTPTFEPVVYQLETVDPVLGGPNGISNLQAKQLGNRTAYLFEKLNNAGLTGRPRQYSGDLNTLITPGFYLVRTGATNKPVNKFGHLYVTGDPTAPDQNNAGISASQIYIVNNVEIPEMYFRVSFALVGFSQWVKLASSADIERLDIQTVGQVAPYAGSTAPTGWLKANGAAVSRQLYPRLFAYIGTRYGAGNGTTTFNLPDLRGEFVRGFADGGAVDNGRTLGSNQGSEVGSHSHTYADKQRENTTRVATDFTPSNPLVNTGEVSENASTNSAGGSETRPRNVALLYCIKY